MNLVEFLQDLSLKGVKLWIIDGGKLKTGGSQEVLTPDAIAQLKEYKSEILEILRENPDVSEVHPLSYGQKGIWFLYQLAPESHNYNTSFAVRIYSLVNIITWQQAFQALRERHPLLRSTFPKFREQPIQQVHKNQKLDFLEIDASSWSEDELYKKVVEAHRHPFKLETEPVVRVRLFTHSERDHVMLVTIHHLAWDGLSASLVMKELPQLYQAKLNGLEVSLPILKHSYQDYVSWQKELVESVEGESLWNYWKQKLAGELPVLNLPTDRPRQPIQTENGGSYPFKLSENLTQKLRKFAQDEDVTLYTILLAAFQVLLSRYTGQEDILVGSPTSGRTKADFADIVGYFVDSVVMRGDLSGNPSLRDFLSQVKQTVVEALTHQDYPFSLLVERLQPERDPSRSPIFQACFVLQNEKLFQTSNKGLIDWGGLQVEPFGFEQYESLYELLLEIIEEESYLFGIFKYNADLFDEQTIAQMAGHFQNLLEEIVNDPQQRITTLPLMTEADLDQLLVGWNNTKTDYPTNKCIHELFESCVEQTPDAVAVVFAQQQLTYSQLNCQANQLAYYLQQLGVKPGVLVGICMERSLEMIVGLLAILKAGGAYVPLDPNYPKSRLNYMVEDAQLSVVLTQEKWRSFLPETIASVVSLDTAQAIITQQSQENLENQVTASDLAYVIYTSGSTGQPKGVSIAHQGLLNLVFWHQRSFEVKSSDRASQVAGVGFDACVWEIWPYLSAGACLQLVNSETRLSPEGLRDWLVLEKITIGFVPTPLLENMCGLKWTPETELRTVLTGGDKLHKYPPTGLPFRVYNNYGPTENTVVTTSGWVVSGEESNISPPIGKPISNTQVYILDENLQVVPIGVPGELHIGGDGLATGYYNRPELTAEKFIPNPFDSSKVLYKTGDLVRYLRDGNIEFLGRIDHQVKIRGFRIETGEIEAALNSYSQVKETVVLAREDSPGEKRLVAYLVLEGEKAEASETEQIGKLKQYLKELLPEYMLPSGYVLLPELPLTPNGKVDRKALPAPDWASTLYVAPETQTQKILADIWLEVLGVEKVGIYDNFFDLGGHSLMATKVASRIRQAFDIDLPLRSFFDNLDVASLAQEVEISLDQSPGIEIVAIRPREKKDNPPPLSFAQQRLWFIEKMGLSSNAYNMPLTLHLVGQLDEVALEKSINQIITRHETLRTTFTEINGTPVQIIKPNVELELPIIDLTQLKPSAQTTELQHLLPTESEQVFNLEVDSPIRAQLFKLGTTEHILRITLHHIASDGWSVTVLPQEISAFYTAIVQNQPCSLPELPIQYADFAIWQRNYLQGQALETQLSYWKQKLQEVPQLQLPTDYPRPAVETFRGAGLPIKISAALTSKIQEISPKHGATLFMTLLAAFKVLLYRYSGQEKIAVGVPIANRNRQEIEGLIGFFVNSLVMCTELGGEASFPEVLEKVKQTAFEAYSHQDIPFEKLVEELQPERSVSKNPIFQVMFAVQQSELVKPSFSLPNLEVGWYEGAGVEMTVRFDLELHLWEVGEEILGYCAYNQDLFKEETISRMLSHYENLLSLVVEVPEEPISKLSLMKEAELEKLLVGWNNTTTDYSDDKCIHQLFEKQVEKKPDDVAVVFGTEKVSYSELNNKANQLAGYLQEKGVKAGELVGICVERSVEMIVGLLAILKAGGAYVPLDPNYPSSRLKYMIKDAQLSVVLTQQKWLEHLPETIPSVICVDTEQEIITQQSQKNIENKVTASNWAYVIYTSGSTGKPKGVSIPHQGVVRLVCNTNYVQLEETDRVAQVSNSSFDAATFEIWGALLNGAVVVVISQSILLSPPEFDKCIRQEQISTLFLTTALFNQLAYSVPGIFSSLKNLLFGGEAVDPTAVKQVLEKGAPERLVHVYGPTENTTYSTWYRVKEVVEGAINIPIGKPISNTQVYILDSNLQPVPIGVAGELHIGGDGLATGYHNRPELTAEKFIANPFEKSKIKNQKSKLYKTGDLVRYLPDGNIEFLGRIDHQVKIRGYRIEIGEIEAVLNSNSKVKETVVLARKDNPGEKRLVAYIVLETETSDSNNNSELSTTQVESWQDIFNQQVYEDLSEVTDPLFNTRGWISNYNNEPIPVEQMRVWAQDIVSQVLAKKPESVWEIGCGTGMLLFQIAPQTQKYYGTDISNVSLSYIKKQIEQQPLAKYAHVSLAQKRAEDMGDVASNSFDVLLLSSIVQYFPSVDYLLQIIEESIRVVKPGGMIFLGDIRSYPLMKAFHSSVQLYQATPSLSIQQLQQQIDRKMQQETELLVSPELFVALQEKHPEITQVQIRLQRGKEHNELRKYRYSVLLHIEAEPASVIEATVESGVGISEEEIESYLRREQPESICWSGIVNERVAKDVELVELLSQPDRKLNVQQLREKLGSEALKSIDPERLYEMSAGLGYSLELCWSAQGGAQLIDAVFVRSELAAQGMVLTPLTQKLVVGENWSSYGNNPLGTQMAKQVIPELREYLESKLPEYMVPSGYVVLSQLPLTPNGKVDRKALPAPDGELVRSQEYVAPQTETEEIIAQIWQEVLGIKQVGIHDNFFEIGGDSIISIQIVARAQKAGIKLTTKQLFQNQTIAEQAAVARVMARVEHQQGIVTGVVPLTPIQHWFWEQNLQEMHHFNQSVLLSVPPEINSELLSRVIEKILQHHDCLRLRFHKTGDGCQQINYSAVESIPFEVVDLSKDSETEQLRLLEEIAAEKQASLNLSDGPIVRVVLFNFGRETEARLLIIIHHLAVDGVSWRILLEDLFDGYQQLLRGETIKLPEKTTAFQDWAIQLVEYGQSQKLHSEVDYWLNQPWSDVVSLPIDYSKIEADNTVGNAVNVSQTLSKEETTALLQEVPSAYNTQINDVLLTALVMSLGEWMGTETVLIDLEGHGREEIFAGVDLSRTVGWFTSMFPVHLKRTTGDIGEALKSVKEQLRKIPERGIGYGILRYLSGDENIRNQLAALPEAEISFNYLGQFNSSQSQQMSWQRAWESAGANQSPQGNRAHWLDINAVIVKGQLQITWIYNSCIYKEETIANQANKYIKALQNLIAHCQSPEAQGFTPSDFPGVDLTQEELDALVLRLQADANNKKNIESIYLLSPMQEGLLFHTNYAPNSGVYIEQVLLTLSGEANPERLKQSWEEVVQRHGVLRTLFVWEGRQKPLQVVRKQVDLPWSYLDWQSLSPTEQQQKLEAFLRSDREEGFELDSAPLMRLTLIKVGNQSYKLLWSFHHILIDGWCLPIIIEEVLSYYESVNQGNRCNLPSVAPYQDYIFWLQQQNQGEAEKFWRESLGGLTAPTPLVVERTPQERQQYTSSYEQQKITLGQTTTIALESLVQKHRLTMASVVQAAWALLLSRYSGESDVLFGVTVSGRPADLSGVEKMVGLFINTLPLRVKVEQQTKLIPWLQELNQKQLQLQTYSYSPLVEIKRFSEIPPGVPLFESFLAFENYPIDRSLQQWSSNLEITEIEGFSQTNYPLNVIAGLTNDNLVLKIGYDPSYFESETIARMLGHLQTLLTAMATNSNLELGQLPLMTEAEIEQILVAWNNNTKIDYPEDKCIHQLFEEQVERTPYAVAVVFEAQRLTYSELNIKANQLAHYLQKLGVKPGMLVGICIERSVEMVVGLLAILKAGGVYVPLEPNYPSLRLNYMVEDAQLSILLIQEKWQHHLSETIDTVICLDTDEEIINQQSQQNLENQVKANQLAYVIYTSGSTGQPKGVTIPHQGLLNLVLWHQRTFGVKSSDRASQIAGVGFDASVWEIWPYLSAGASLYLVNSETRLSPEALKNWLVSEKITISFVPTPLLENLCSLKWPVETELRTVLTGGDKLHKYPSAALPFCVFNNYGPTENTVVTTSGLVVSGQGSSVSPPIGKPISNTQVYILDSQLQPVPIGVAGEIHIGGDSLATGYHNRPELTAEKFIPNPFDQSQATKLYKTGDLGRYLPDGNIEFIGRIDHQVKVRGYRIETGEIEATLTQNITVKETVVLAREDNSGNKDLVAYLVLESQTPEVSEIEQIDKVKHYLKQQLPEYMIPRVFVPLSQLPLTPNGKVDRKALPAPDLASSVSTEYVAPETETQKVLAEIWAEVLGIEKVGIHDNFFDLGGHSLLATQIGSRIRQVFDVEFPIRKIFESSTVESISKYIDACIWAAKTPPITQDNKANKRNQGVL